uniref:Uncharacterized protein n=1 Tax=Anguilla anguilla TaxID=7936 RepID=A0A0E9Q2G3_ANGAN
MLTTNSKLTELQNKNQKWTIKYRSVYPNTPYLPTLPPPPFTDLQVRRTGDRVQTSTLT